MGYRSSYLWRRFLSLVELRPHFVVATIQSLLVSGCSCRHLEILHVNPTNCSCRARMMIYEPPELVATCDDAMNICSLRGFH
ncbi:hypothetical protein EDD85DRAFT_855827 [Armillaria nabsnona]|nr:hypothetical protein EDD85DRAFT_855827 [Armillaria nabsnona]